jgi:octaprenyl-diphosphate synthase
LVANGAPVETVKEKLLDGNRLERARVQARQLVESGIDAIGVLPDSPHREALISLANSVINRTK